MKRKIGLVIAILLCVVLVLTFVACKKNKNNETTPTEPSQTGVTVSAEDQATMQAKIDSYIETWLLTNAQETGKVTSQKGLLSSDLKAQEDVFSFTDSNLKYVKPTFDVSYKSTETGGEYTIKVIWTKASITQTFVKAAKTVDYENWAGKNSRLSDDWLSPSAKGASDAVDKLVAAGVKTINLITGNAKTGKFGADGVIGVSVAGKNYGLRVKGNVDGTTKTNNEIGLVLVDGEKELGGLYYKAAATAKDSKLYFQYATTDEETGNLARDDDNNIIYGYKYIDYADIYGLIEKFFPKVLPEEYPEADDGVINFKDKSGAQIPIKGLESLLNAAGAGSVSTFVVAGVNMFGKGYQYKGRHYIDINLGSAIAQVSDLMTTLPINLDFLDDLGVDLANLKGLLGHITISGKVDADGYLSDFEIAINIPKCTFYLNNKEGDDALKFDIPAVSFALFIEDFSFLTDEEVEDVIPEGTKDAVYFSPANIDISGDLYIKHVEGSGDDANIKLDDTFHFELVTDINPFEIASKGFDSEARAALVIKQSQGNVYDAETATNFLSVSYEQKDKLLCLSGTALKMEDGGNQVYTFRVSTTENILKELKLWLGMDTEHNNWHGLALDDNDMLVLLDYVLTSDTKFKAEKTYYVLNKDGAYEEAKDIVVGADVPKNTYYVKSEPYESAKTIFGNDAVKAITNLIVAFLNKKEESKEDPADEVAAAFDPSVIGDYFEDFKALYNKFIDSGKINFGFDENDKAFFKADISLEMINDVINAINETFKVTFDEITEPEYVKVFLNTEPYLKKLYITTKVDGNVYELTFDDSVAKTFKIDFVMTTSSREYAFNFTAVKSNDGTTWTASVTFNILDDSKTVTSTLVRLSDFHGKWGKDNSTRVEELIPTATQKAAALPIFPAEDIPSVGTNLAKAIITIISNEKIFPVLMDVAGMFLS